MSHRLQNLGAILAQGEAPGAEMKLKSMDITNEPKYKEMKYKKDAAMAEGSHFARIEGAEKTVKEDGECPTDISFARVVEMEKQAQAGAESLSKNQRLFAVHDRLVWQQEFGRSVDRLLVDFELTQDPNIRVRHLDHMYGWFKDQGGKQERKIAHAPNYLTLDNLVPPTAPGQEPMPPPPGSARGMGGEPSAAAVALSTVYDMPLTPRPAAASERSPRRGVEIVSALHW
jgi:hypothetical protein